MTGYNFTTKIRNVLANARKEATSLGHEYVGTEHLLLALIDDRRGVTGAMLKHLYADPDEIRIKVEEVVRRGERVVRSVGFALHCALKESVGTGAS